MLSQASPESATTEKEEATWDPIEDVLEDERGNYINMIHHFLWDDGAVDVEVSES
jgi:hypothetical protein